VAASSVAKGTRATNDQKVGTAELLFRAAQGMGLGPAWINQGDLFAVSVDDHEQYINLACSPLNSHTAASLAKDKYVTRRILERHNMPNIPFARPKTQASAEAFLHEHGKIVAKPVTGSGARDIHIITEPLQLQTLAITQYILEKYIAGEELRYLILNNSVIGVHRSDYGLSVEEGRALERISYPTTDWNEELVSTSLQVAQILSLKFAAVDYLIDAAGHAYILEVNTTPGLKWFHAPTSGPVVDVAQQFLAAIFKEPAKPTHH
jgi:glutathione synthase/RimK-type ligase-like ATP-grasp enzyme